MEPTMESTHCPLTFERAAELMQDAYADVKFRKCFQGIICRAFPRAINPDRAGREVAAESCKLGGNRKAARDSLCGDPNATDDLLGDVAVWLFERVAARPPLNEQNFRGLLTTVAFGKARDRLSRSALQLGYTVVPVESSDETVSEVATATGGEPEDMLARKHLIEYLEKQLTEWEWRVLDAKVNGSYEMLAEESHTQVSALRQQASRLCARIRAEFELLMSE